MQLEHLLTFTVVIGENTPIGVGLTVTVPSLRSPEERSKVPHYAGPSNRLVPTGCLSTQTDAAASMCG